MRQAEAAVRTAALAPADHLALFATLSAVTTLLHRLAVPNWITTLTYPSGWLSVIFSIALLFRPSSTRVLGLYLVASVAEWGRLMPSIPNHLLFEGLVHVTLLIALVRRALPRSRGPVDRALLLRDLAPIVRVELLVMYAFAFLHKLNHDFLNPEVSCAVSMHHELASALPILPTDRWVDYPIIGLTLAFEGGIPLLLAFRRTAHLGVLAGLFFHMLLAAHPHPAVFSFTAMLYCLYFLFLSEPARDEVVAYFGRMHTAYRRLLPSISPRLLPVVAFFLALSGMALMSLAGVWFRTLVLETTRIGFWLFLAWAAVLVPGYVLAIARTRRRPQAEAGWLSPFAAPHFVVIALLTLNGLSPYLGLKTLSTFSMFSNLRTENSPNHLFMPQLYLTDWQTDHARIVSSSLHGTASECDSIGAGMWCSYPDERVPTFELRRWMSHRLRQDKSFRAEIEHKGKRLSLPADARELVESPSWLEHKLIALRFVQDPDAPMTCKW